MSEKIKYQPDLFNASNFLISSWKPIIVGLVFGLIISLGYLFLAPKYYFASLNITFPSILDQNQSEALNQDPKVLAYRLPNLIDADALPKDCPLKEVANNSHLDKKKVFFEHSKIYRNTIEVKVIAASLESAKKCVEAIFDEITKIRALQLATLVIEIKSKLIDNSKAINDLRGQTVLSNEVRYQPYEFIIFREKLVPLLEENRLLTAALLKLEKDSPVLLEQSKNSDPLISPNRKVVLLAGIVLGLFFGGLAAITARILSRVRNQLK